MESRISRIERSVEYLIGKVKKQSEWIYILEEKVRDLECGNVAENKCLLSDSEKQAVSEHIAKFKPTNNQKRDNVIWKAQRFINEHKGNGQKQYHFPKMRAFIFYDIDFKVNKSKRTVTGYLIGVSTKHVHKKVTVKCRPDEVFNATLGKAIVVGRLLDLDVSEFENAPQPDEFAVGQNVLWSFRDFREKFNVTKIHGNMLYDNDDEWVNQNECIILDDTEAKY